MKKMNCRESITCGAMNTKLVLMFVIGMMMMMMMMRVGGELVSAGKKNHVVGEDRGWDAESDVASWSSKRLFFVGDDIWFAFSAAEEMVTELSSKDEFEACNVSNPIRTYADGLNIIRLESQGHRFFTSSNPESCKNGLKLHVDVLPRHRHGPQWESALGDAPPPKPSASSLLIPSSFCILWSAIACYFFFLIHHHHDYLYL